jgi:hypothetical protein
MAAQNIPKNITKHIPTLGCNEWLVVWNMNLMTFHSVGNGKIIPTDEVHHFSEGWLNHQPAMNGEIEMSW